MGYGKALKEELRKQGRSVAWLSRETGITLNTLYAIIKRDSESTRFGEQINKAVGVNLYESVPLEEIKAKEIDSTEPLSITITIEGELMDELMNYIRERSLTQNGNL